MKRTYKTGHIYVIDVGPKDFYIGQTVDFAQRKSAHLCELKKGKKSLHFQRAYDKYKTFTMMSLIEAPIDMLNKIEQTYINLYWGNPSFLNAAKDVQAPGRGLQLRLGKKHSEETKKILSELSKERVGKKSNRYIGGRTFYHNGHGAFVGAVCELVDKYPDQRLLRPKLYDVYNGRRIQHKGWTSQNPS